MDTTFDILEALRQRGLKQVEISRRTGIPQPRLSKWARGHVPAGADDALKLRRLLDTPAPAPQGEVEHAT